MDPQKNGKNHFLVGQEMNGSVVVSCIETKSPSGNRWLKIHREFALKNGSKFWLDQLISREKGEETLADWLKEQAELKAKKEAAQAKAREMAKQRIQARNGKGRAPPVDSTKTKLELPSQKHKPASSRTNATTPISSNDIEKPAPLRSSVKSQPTEVKPGGQTQTASSLKAGPRVETQKPSSARTSLGEESGMDVAKSPKKPASSRTRKLHLGDDIEESPEKQTQKPSSARTSLGVENGMDVAKLPKKPASSRTRKLHLGDDIEESPKKDSSGRLQGQRRPNGKATKRSPSRDKKLRSRRESSLKAKMEAEEEARLEAEEMARREAEEKERLKLEEIARQEAEDKAHFEAAEKATLSQQAEERRRIEQIARVEESQRIDHDKHEAGEKALVEALGDIGQSSNNLGTADLIAELPEDNHSSTAVVKTPYDEVLADSSSRMGHSDSDVDTKKKRRKKKENNSAKSDDKKRRKPKAKRSGELGSETSGLDINESSKIDTKHRKSKTTTDSGDSASAASGMDLSDSSRKKKKKKKKKDSRKCNDAGASHEDLEKSQSSLRANDSKARTKSKKKKKEKEDRAESTKTSRGKEKEDVVSDIHTQLEAMFELSLEVQSAGVEEAANYSNKSQDVPTVPPFQDDDSDDGSAEFHVDPAMLDHPLDDYSSDEPSSDSDDDFDYTRVAGINDFDNSGVVLSQRAPASRSSKTIADVAQYAEDSGHDEKGDEAVPAGSESKENMNFSSLEELKDASPSFTKIMGTWVERENKTLYRTPLETVERRSDGRKEVPVPTGPEAPSLGSMVRKWEAKFVKEEPEISEDAPRKLKNVWAEKLEFTKPFTKPSHKKSADEIKLIEDTVEKNFAFRDLTPDEMAPIIDAFKRVEYDLGAMIGEQGEPEGFYSIVQSGEVAFHSGGNQVGSAVAGDAFGELSLLYSVPLAAEATAADNQTVLFQLDRTNFRHIVREQMIRSEEVKLKLLQSVEVFKNLDETDLRQLASAMVPHQFKKGENLSSTFAEAPFCLVQQGSVSATDVAIGPGESFGEKSLIAQENKRYEVKAMSDGMAFTIDRESFEKVFGDFDRVSMKYRDKQTLVCHLFVSVCFRCMFVI
jgi:CRP-like cAMP-binding protein